MLTTKLNWLETINWFLNEKFGRLAIAIYLPIVYFIIKYDYLGILVGTIILLGVWEILNKATTIDWLLTTSLPYTIGLIYICTLPPEEQLLVVVVVFAGDTGAFIGGKYLTPAKRKKFMFPKISPNKTWQGFWIGFFTAILMGILVILKLQSSPMLFLLLPIVYLAAVLGDLLGSKFKRSSGVKDSGDYLWTGHWMFGHGGVYDRFGALSMASLFFCLIIKFIK